MYEKHQGRTCPPRGGVNFEIEALRGVAILFVLYQHLGVLFAWRSDAFAKSFNYTGLWGVVDLFFCISGYVIAGSLFRQFNDSARANLGSRLIVPFWIRRIYRLYPSLLLWSIVFYSCSLLVNSSGAFGDPAENFKDLLAAHTNVANFRFVEGIKENKAAWNGIYWSLSLEEQFYLVFPVLLLVVPSRWWTHCLVALVAAQFFLPRDPGTLLWAVRTDAMAIGILIARAQASSAYEWFAPTPLRNRAVSVVFTILVIAFLAVMPSPLRIVSFSTGMLAAISGLLVFVASFGKGFLFSGSVRDVLAAVGRRSYSIYLIHMTAYALTHEFWVRHVPATELDGRYTLRFLLTAGLLLAVLVELNFRFVERPLRNKGRVFAAQYSRRAEAQLVSSATGTPPLHGDE